MPTSIRLDPETEQRLEAEARRRATTKSDLVRVAVEEWLGAQEAPDGSLFDSIADLVGSVGGGPPTLSEETGSGFRALLTERAR